MFGRYDMWVWLHRASDPTSPIGGGQTHRLFARAHRLPAPPVGTRCTMSLRSCFMRCICAYARVIGLSHRPPPPPEVALVALVGHRRAPWCKGQSLRELHSLSALDPLIAAAQAFGNWREAAHRRLRSTLQPGSGEGPDPGRGGGSGADPGPGRLLVDHRCADVDISDCHQMVPSITSTTIDNNHVEVLLVGRDVSTMWMMDMVR